METYRELAQRVKHREFWLQVVLFSNFNFYVLFYSMYVCKYFQFDGWFLLVITRIVLILNKITSNDTIILSSSLGTFLMLLKDVAEFFAPLVPSLTFFLNVTYIC